MNEYNWLLAPAALVLGLILVPVAAKLAIRIGAVDKPNARKVHTKIMPRMGGLGIYLSFLIVVLLSQPLSKPLAGLLLGGTVLIAVGIIDDIKDLPAKVKLVGQIAAALIVMAFGVRVEFMTNFLYGNMFYLDILAWPVTLLWIVGITNAVNLIDGLDGLAAGVSIIAALTLAWVSLTGQQYQTAVLALILAGATLGFLRYNFHPAKVFMGDTGALFLGFNLSVLSIMGMAKSVTFISLVTPILVLGIPIFDTFFAIIRRKMNHKPVFKPDKEHLHHRLLSMGFSHRKTVLVIYGINIFLAGSAIIMHYVTTAQAMCLLVIISSVVLVGAGKLGIIGFRIPVNHKNLPERRPAKDNHEK